MKTKLFIFSLLVLSTLCFATDTQAASSLNIPESIGAFFSSTTPPLTSAPCTLFDARAIQTSITLEKYSQDPGMSLKGTLTIKNTGVVPLADVGVFIKIYSKENDANKLVVSGNNLIDQKYIESSTNLGAHAERNISFSVPLPYYAPSGEYEIVPFVVPQNKSSENAIYTDGTLISEGAPTSFVITDAFKGFIGISKDAVTLDTRPYSGNTLTKSGMQVRGQKPITINTNLINTTSSIKEKVELTWNLYTNDGGVIKKIDESAVKTFNLLPGKNTKVSYTINDTSHATYLLVGEVTSQRVKSLLEVRIVRPENSALNVNYISLSPFPLVKDKASTLALCVSAYNQPIASSHLLSTITDAQGNTLFSQSVDGTLLPLGVMQGEFNFKPTQTINDVRVNAVLSGAGAHAEKSVAFNCQNNDCKKDKGMNQWVPLVVSLAGILAFILLIIAHAIHKHHANNL